MSLFVGRLILFFAGEFLWKFLSFVRLRIVEIFALENTISRTLNILAWFELFGLFYILCQIRFSDGLRNYQSI
jgi:hypothetical protein